MDSLLLVSKNRLHSLSAAGFTLLEQIIVVLIIGILAVFFVPRFQGSSGFTEYTMQSRLISSMRNMQQRAMQDTRTGYCFQVNILPTSTGTPGFGPPSLNYSGAPTPTCSSAIDYSNPEFLRTDSDELNENDVFDVEC